MNIPIKMNGDFEKSMAYLSDKYGEDFAYLNGFWKCFHFWDGSI